MGPADLFPGAPREALEAAHLQAGLVRQALCLPTVASTNDIAREAARAGAEEGLLVLAEEQTAGRGRGGRRWQAPPASSLLASLLLRPTFLDPAQAFLLTALAALGIAEAVGQVTGLEAALKWPNDLLLSGRKACGILVEVEAAAGRLEWAVLGWGLNVNTRFGDDELAPRAISLAEAAGQPWPRLPLLHACLERLETHYQALRAGRGEAIWTAWRARLETLGREVAVAAPGGDPVVGLALDVAPDGALLVRRADGGVERVLAGDIATR